MAEIVLASVDRDATLGEQLEKSGAMAVQTAKDFKVACQDDYEKGAKYLTGIKTRMSQITEYWKESKAATNAAHKAVVAQEKQMLKPLQDAEAIIKKTMLDYQRAVEIDFLISNGSKLKPKIYPIEVKSSKRYTTKSLDKFVETFHNRIGEAYIIHTKNLSKQNDVICIPAYMTFCL